MALAFNRGDFRVSRSDSALGGRTPSGRMLSAKSAIASSSGPADTWVDTNIAIGSCGNSTIPVRNFSVSVIVARPVAVAVTDSTFPEVTSSRWYRGCASTCSGRFSYRSLTATPGWMLEPSSSTADTVSSREAVRARPTRCQGPTLTTVSNSALERVSCHWSGGSVKRPKYPHQ